MSWDFDPRRLYWFGPPAISVCIVAGISMLVASTSFSYRHWQMPEQKFHVTRAGHVVAPLLDDLELLAGGTAVAVTPEQEHFFEVMNPLSTASYEFVVRNEGDRPLLLRTGPTTCKCTVARLGHSRIAPGEEGRVKLVWNTGRHQTEFAQTAVIYTNDPKRREITFKVLGQVRVRLATIPGEVVFANLAPDQPETRDITLFTRYWHQLEFVSANCSIEGVGWMVEPLEPQQLDKVRGRGGLRLRITSPPAGASSPQFQGSLAIRLQTYRNAHDPDPVEEVVEIPISGNHLGRLGIYGADVNAHGEIDLGKIERGDARTSRLVCRVRDREPDLRVQRVEVEPSFVQAHVTRHKSRPGVYFLDLMVPKDAPDFVGHSGRIGIVVDHPRIASPELTLDFSIMDYSR